MILSNIPQELDSLAGDIALRNKMKFELLQKCHTVYNYLIQVLNSEGLPDKFIELAFKTIEEWVIKSDKFYSHEGIFELLFNAVKSKWFKQVKDIMVQVITKSSNTKLFMNVKYEEAFKSIQPEERKFLELVKEFIFACKDDFEADLTNPDSEFCKEIADLTWELLSNFEILLLEEAEQASPLFEFLYLILRHSSRNISIRALELFGDLKETLCEIKSEVKGADYLLEPYYNATRITFEKCKKKLIQMNEDGTFAEPDDSDDEGQESIDTYRDYAADLFFNTYYIGGLFKGRECKEHFEQILLEKFQQNDQSSTEFAQSVEVSLFAARNTIDAVDLPEDKLIEVIWTTLLKISDFKEPTVFLSALGFFSDGSIYLEHNKAILPETLQYIIEGFNLYHKMPRIQSSIFKCLVEIGQNSSSCFDESTFEIFLTFIEQNAAIIDKDNCSNAMEGICSLCSVLDDDKLPMVMHRTVKWSTDTFPEIEFSDPAHRIVFIKSLLMLSGAIKILSRFREQAIKDTLKPILDTFLVKIGEALKFYEKDKEVYLTICNFYSKCIKALNTEFSPYFEWVATDCFTSFNNNRDNIKCIDVCCLAISLIGGTPEVKHFIENNFNDLVSCILQKLESNHDMDLIKAFAELWCMVTKKVSPVPIVTCPDLRTLIILFSEFLMNTIENDANTEIIFFLHDLICNPNTDVRRWLTEYIEYIGTAFITAIPNMRSVVSQTFGKCLSQICKEYPDMMVTCIDNAFKNPKFNEVSENVKKVFKKWLIGFKDHGKQFKLTILDFQAVMRGTASEDAFIGRELKLNELTQQNEIIEV